MERGVWFQLFSFCWPTVALTTEQKTDNKATRRMSLSETNFNDLMLNLTQRIFRAVSPNFTFDLIGFQIADKLSR